MAMAYAVKVSQVDQQEQAKSISNIESQNPFIRSKVIIFCIYWHMKMLKRGKKHGPLFLEVGTSCEAKTLVQEGLLHDWELKDCERYIQDYTLTQCYRCYGYILTAMMCKGRKNCGHCAKEHASNSCPTSDNPATSHCCNCMGKHTAWLRQCPERAARAGRLAAAYESRPSLYKSPAKMSPETSCTHPPPPPSH